MPLVNPYIGQPAKDLVDAAADSVHPRVDRVRLDRLSDVPADRGVVERIVLIEINVVAVVAVNVVTLGMCDVRFNSVTHSRHKWFVKL